MNTLKFSFNPYNVNRMTQAAGEAMLDEAEYTASCCAAICENREYLTKELAALGFDLTPSSANFVFAKHSSISGAALYSKLKSRGVLVRHFSDERIKDYCRITVGDREQIDTLIEKIKEIQEELI